MSANLECLDHHPISIDLEVGGTVVPLTGVGAMYEDPALGKCLKIHVEDGAGAFDVILRQSEWNGEILSSAQFGCDYHISLGSGAGVVAAAG